MLKLIVIHGTIAPVSPKEKARKRARASNPAAMLSCHRCGGREVLETRIGMLIKEGKPSGGTKTFLCATCHRSGERVVLA